MRSGERKLGAATATRMRAAALGLLGVVGCQGGNTNGGTPAGSATASASAAPAPVASASAAGSASAEAALPKVPEVSLTSEDVIKVMNPKRLAPYSGATGTLRGRVTVKGDPPPSTGLSFPTGKCGEAAATYGRLFRVGQQNALADALVTVVNYDGYVPEREEVEKVTIHGCAFSSRTVAMSYGQRVEVWNLDPLEPYMPNLDGAPFTAVLVAMPQGDPVKFYPPQPGYYTLTDKLPKPFLKADVFVLKFPTHDVTDLDGRFEIKNIPVGKVLTAALLPAISKDAKKQIEIKEGDNTVDFELEFNLEKFNEAKRNKK
ncbi:hypothetical protein SOCE26_052110 [Sorangium cellulosum]|uniref:Secreted protein n=1 Tax=Sorangium cellulosum TaxID=56 RepID=A0A2L0EWT9_SORCE|nr:hypothetical protein [Sorangium cellulosum]AUX43756.1 hypothetical protein SOCE26_052110 [Sorangium cellulosum]